MKRAITLLSLFLLSTSTALCQAPPLDHDREEIADKDIPKSSDINTMYRFVLSPETDNVIRTDAERAIVEKVIKYYLYRLTWEEVQQDRDPARVGTIGSIMTDLVGHAESSSRLLPRPFTGQPDQDQIATRARQLENLKQIAPIIVKYCKVVLLNKQPIARINAARVLAKLAEWGQEPAVDELINIIKHPGENDAVRHWAFKGLEDIFGLAGTNDIRAKGLFQGQKGADRYKAALTAIFDWLTARTKVPESRLKYMQPEEKEGLRYVRRAAELALGASRRPLILDERSAGKQEGPIAELLSRIVTADAGIVPAPSLRERLDASIALGQLRNDFSPSYQPDYAAETIGRFLAELGAQANADKDNKGVNAFAWPTEAQRLQAALTGFVSQKTSVPTKAYLDNLKPKANALLVFFDDFAKNTGAVKDLSDWLRDNPSPSREIYKPLGQK
jgi:hypothetical protein